MCPALRGSTVSYAGGAHFPKHSLESLNFWSQSKKKMKFTKGNIELGQFWYTAFWVLDPPPSQQVTH